MSPMRTLLLLQQPVESCMSLHVFGVSHMKFDAVDVEPRSLMRVSDLLFAVPARTTREHIEGVFRMLLKYSNGLWRTAYLPLSETPVEQSSGPIGLSSR